MNIMGGIAKGIGAIVSPIANIYLKKQERKTKKIEVDGKVALAKQNGENEVAIGVSDWESRSKSNENETWKDEYVTLVVTLPLVLILLGAVYFVFTGDDRLLKGAQLGIQSLKDIGLDMGELMYVVVFAAVSIKAYKSL